MQRQINLLQNRLRPVSNFVSVLRPKTLSLQVEQECAPTEQLSENFFKPEGESESEAQDLNKKSSFGTKS